MSREEIMDKLASYFEIDNMDIESWPWQEGSYTDNNMFLNLATIVEILAD